MLVITTSWDDGDILDVKLAALLQTYGVKGTFYISQNYREKRLSEKQIKDISSYHEIGAHTLSHADLQKLSADEQRKEIAGSKQWLESILNKEVGMFCYPFGRLAADSAALVKEIGFKGARTTEYGRIDYAADPFLTPTTIHIYPFPFRKTGPHSYYWRKLFQPLLRRGPVFREAGVPIGAFYSWKKVACALFDIAHERGEVFHLWGHSWEIEKYDMWDDLEYVLKHISGRKDCQYLTNGDSIESL